LREQQARRAADRRQDDALGDQLTNDAPAVAADGGTDRELALARRGAHQQQVGDIRARDQQHEHHRAHQRDQLRSHVGDQVVVHRLDAQVHVRGLFDRKALPQIGGEAIGFGCACSNDTPGFNFATTRSETLLRDPVSKLTRLAIRMSGRGSTLVPGGKRISKRGAGTPTISARPLPNGID
jgi:hypothetical protein